MYTIIVHISFLQQYLARRILTGLHRTIRLSFMLAGHTKFSPDWCFGLLKQKYRRTFVSCLDDVVNVVNSSADVNVAQLVGTQIGEPLVTTHDWTTFLSSHFRHVTQLKSYQHFTFSVDHPDTISLKEYSDSPSSLFSMLVDDDWCPQADELPPVVAPAGLSHKRQTYLYQQIREFCRPGTEDLTCPRPIHHCQSSPSSSEDERAGLTPPKPKRIRRCGKCGKVGQK